MDLKNSKSMQNLKTAFAGESQARNKYTYYAEKAHAEGNEEVAELFEKMAVNETAHAKIWFRMIHDGIQSSEKNLQEAMTGEHYEWTNMYKQFAEEARSEGFPEIGDMFDRVAEIEHEHERRFMQMYGKIVNPQQQEQPKKEKLVYRCRYCGHIEEIKGEAPYVCPVCGALGVYEKAVIEE